MLQVSYTLQQTTLRGPDRLDGNDLLRLFQLPNIEIVKHCLESGIEGKFQSTFTQARIAGIEDTVVVD